ncbi:helix-turn-helix domain-containing protein [Streptomyces sp. S1]|uniref:helix-turn-helix domain-containing protein n=1 Tax=Streptomyces sp. S1 TaxID=718288 RepID=UPI003D74C553
MTTTTEAAAVAARRAAVAALRDKGHSIRAIAKELTISKDTVHRDLKARPRDTTTPPDQDQSAPVAPDTPTVADTPPPPATPVSRLTELSRDTPPPAATPPATPPVPCLTIPLDQALIADLATLTRNGTRPQAAIRYALARAANTYRQAWDAGLYPRTADPVISRHQYAPYQPPEPPA